MKHAKKLQSIFVLEDNPASILANIAASQYPNAELFQPNSVDNAQKIIKKNKPDLIIIDLSLIDDEITEFINAVKINSPKSTCVVASHIEEDKELFLALKAGAKGYLLKDKEEDQILKHLINILDGQPTVAPAIAYQMLGYFHRQPNFENQEALSDRESEILKLIASGHKRASVAEKLSISLNTVATHLKTIYRKLNINSRAEATMEALRRGLIKK
ncbi:hypothetical protein MNBD_GAMMA21-2067 [hydrothermal vent metagenome]|uniref:DNA-binding response regulator n=1 Tax=hydrothermal vent metagenome TaxID=652676 RepID=A0A3B1A3S0_9ZZZZ